MAEEKKVIPLLQPKRIQGGDYVRTTWRIVAEEAHTKEDILHPTYWAHAAQRMKRGDIVEVVNDTESFFMLLYVRNVGKGFANVFPLSYTEFDKQEVPEAETIDYEVKWKGPSKKYCIIRIQDGVAIKSEIEKKEEAQLWLREYLKTIPDVKEA